jgi:hypothetical protein
MLTRALTVYTPHKHATRTRALTVYTPHKHATRTGALTIYTPRALAQVELLVNGVKATVKADRIGDNGQNPAVVPFFGQATFAGVTSSSSSSSRCAPVVVVAAGVHQ